MAQQSDPKAAAFIIIQGLLPALLQAEQQYLSDMEAGGYARNSLLTARTEIDGFLHWLAGKRKVNPRQRVAEHVAALTMVLDSLSETTAPTGS